MKSSMRYLLHNKQYKMDKNKINEQKKRQKKGEEKTRANSHDIKE